MDLHTYLLTFFILSSQWLLTRTGDEINMIPEIHNAELVNETCAQQLEGKHIRVKCINGYVRKVGTSDSYICERKGSAFVWNNPLPLVCIRRKMIPQILNAEKVNETCDQQFKGEKVRVKCINGYVRKAGTSNLYKCEHKESTFDWINPLPLVCIPDPKQTTTKQTSSITNSPATTGPSSSVESRTLTSTMTGQTTPYRVVTTTGTTHSVVTTTHRVVTTTEISIQTTLRTTTKEEESLATANRLKPSSPSIFTNSESTDSPASRISGTSKGGIAAGVVLVIVAGCAGASAFFICHRRSQAQVPIGPEKAIHLQPPETAEPLLHPPSNQHSPLSDPTQHSHSENSV